MYAVIKSGGKQIKVAKDDIIQVEKLAADDRVASLFGSADLDRLLLRNTE